MSCMPGGAAAVAPEEADAGTVFKYALDLEAQHLACGHPAPAGMEPVLQQLLEGLAGVQVGLAAVQAGVVAVQADQVALHASFLCAGAAGGRERLHCPYRDACATGVTPNTWARQRQFRGCVRTRMFACGRDAPAASSVHNERVRRANRESDLSGALLPLRKSTLGNRPPLPAGRDANAVEIYVGAMPPWRLTQPAPPGGVLQLPSTNWPCSTSTIVSSWRATG